MGAHLRVKVPLQAGHSEQSEAQLHEGDRVWEGSAGRVNRESINKNLIDGVAKQGEQAPICKALVTKVRWRTWGDCAVKVCVLTRGDSHCALRLNWGHAGAAREGDLYVNSP